jgi:hypothetical protein
MSKKFIDKNKAVIIKLSHRDQDDPNYNKSKKDELVYEIISYPTDEKLTES